MILCDLCKHLFLYFTTIEFNVHCLVEFKDGRVIFDEECKKVVMGGVEPSTVALLAQRSNQLSYTTSLPTMDRSRVRGL